MRSVAALKPYARNPRQTFGQQIRQIADSIREFGFTNPLLIDADGGLLPVTADSKPPSCLASPTCQRSASTI